MFPQNTLLCLEGWVAHKSLSLFTHDTNVGVFNLLLSLLNDPVLPVARKHVPKDHVVCSWIFK